MSADLIDRLRALSRYAHDDKSIGDEAADAIEQLQVDVERLRQMSEDAARYRFLAERCSSQDVSDDGGQWVIVINGPVPPRHDEEDAFDAAIDAAMKGSESE